MLKKIILLLIVLSMTACVSVKESPGRSKALALAAENSMGLLAVASLPVRYYCKHHYWPTHFHPFMSQKHILWSIHHLHYSKNDDDDSDDYQADFELSSYLPKDHFNAEFHMDIAPPDVSLSNMQMITVTLESDEYAIFMPLNYEYSCKVAMQSSHVLGGV